VPLIFLVFALHAAAALLVWWLLAGLATRALAGRSRPQRAVATLAALLAGVVVSQVFPIYRDPFRALPDVMTPSPDNASELPPDRAALGPPDRQGCQRQRRQLPGRHPAAAEGEDRNRRQERQPEPQNPA
jgi:hypothetical protein